MSEIRWCDPGGHPFSLNDPAREEYVSNAPVAEGQRRTRLDICGPCKDENAMGLQTFGAPPKAKAAVEAEEFVSFTAFGAAAASMGVAPGTTVRIPKDAAGWTSVNDGQYAPSPVPPQPTAWKDPPVAK